MGYSSNCSLAEGFSLGEKIYAQVTFIGMGLFGTIGIILTDWVWVIPYVFVYWYGIPGIVQRHINCPRCPHLYIYGDCLQFHPVLTKWSIKKRKTNPFSTSEKLIFYTIFILIPTYPTYWLFSNKIILSAFLICAVLWYSGQFIYFCKRCRLRECPFNSMKIWA